MVVTNLRHLALQWSDDIELHFPLHGHNSRADCCTFCSTGCQYDQCINQEGQVASSFSSGIHRTCATSRRSALAREALCFQPELWVQPSPYTKCAQCPARLVSNLPWLKILYAFQSISGGFWPAPPISLRHHSSQFVFLSQSWAWPHYQSTQTFRIAIFWYLCGIMGTRVFLATIRWCILHKNCGRKPRSCS